MNRTWCKSFTLLEVMIAFMIFSIVIVGVLNGLIQTARLNYANSHQVAAYGLGYDALELLRAEEYDDVTNDNELLRPDEMKLTHLGGTDRVPLDAWRWGEVIEKNDPRRKHVTIWVGWNYRQRNHFEKVEGVIYPE